MSKSELSRLKAQIAVLRDVAKEYHGRSIDNIIDNLGARVKYIEERMDDLGLQNHD